MVIIDFQIKDKTSKPRIFYKTFLIANTKFEVILKMLFLKLSNTNMSFDKKTLMWRTYTINKALSTTKQVQIIDKKDFVIVALNINSETFVIYVAIQEQKEISMASKRQVQIKTQKKAQVGALIFNKDFTKILAEYFDYSNIFLIENIAELLENIGINEYAIKLEKNKQLLFEFIYSLKLVKLETLKIYIKLNLVNSFI